MPAVKGKDPREGPLPSKTIQFTDFSKGLMRTGSRDGIPDEGLWQSLNAQVIGPGRVITLPDPGASIATLDPPAVSVWGVMIQIDKVETERLIAIQEDGAAVAIDPLTGALTTITPAGGLDPTARVTMWQDTHVLFAGITSGFSSWDGTTFLTYPATFEGTTTVDSSSVVWFDGPIPISALVPGMAISGDGIPAGTTIAAVGGNELDSPATFAGDTVSGFPTVLWTGGPTLPSEFDSGVVISGPGIPAGTSVVNVVGADLPANATFLADTLNGSSQVRYKGGATAVGDLKSGLRVVGAGFPAGVTLLSIQGDQLPVGATFTAATTLNKNKITYTGGATPNAALVSGMIITGPGIPAGTTITAIGGAEITLSKNVTITQTSALLTVGPTLTLAKNATATATTVPVTTGPTILMSKNASATATGVSVGAQGTITLLLNTATASGTVTLTIGEGAPKGTALDPESQGVRDLAAFEGRIWLVSAPRGILFTGPGSFTSFQTVYAAGAVNMPDSVFPGPITTIRAAVQLLWIYGPGAINTLSNVQIVSGLTIYQNENLVAGTGTASPDSVQPLFRTMVFLSPPGVYAILGATPQKLSDPLDGIMPEVSPVGTAPAAVFNLNALLVYAVLVDFDGQRRLLIYSRPRWLIADQGPDLRWITTLLRLDGSIQCWGTNGPEIRQLFAGEVGDWDLRLKMFDFGMFTRRDTMRRIAVRAETVPRETPAAFDPDLQVEVENETTTTATLGGILANEVTWINDLGDEIPWINAVAAPVTWVASGTLIYLAEVKFSGNYLSAHIFGRRSVPLLIGGVAMEIGSGGEWTFAP